MILDACFQVPKLEDSILNFQILFDKRKVKLKMSQHIRRTCLWSVTLKVADIATDLDPYTRKQQQVSVHAKCYNKKILFPTYLSGSTYQLNVYIHLLIW